jgi:hypothetical protein
MDDNAGRTTQVTLKRPGQPGLIYMNPFRFIKAAQFFPVYAPQVKNVKEKLAAKVAQFTEADKAAICAGLTKLFTDLSLTGDIDLNQSL